MRQNIFKRIDSTALLLLINNTVMANGRYVSDVLVKERFTIVGFLLERVFRGLHRSVGSVDSGKSFLLLP